ncbi:MAG: sugar porter family MFS transporter [Acidimicrobiia bacterium]
MNRVMTKRLYLVGAVILTAGILFGYDQGVISGALRGIEKDFDLGTTMVEVVTSFVTLGALVGALIAGVLADRIGRRPTLLFAGVLFIVGAVIEAAAPGSGVLVVGRLTVGLAVGVASVAAPLFAAEMAPTRLRGSFVSTYQFGITFGIFVAYLVDEWLQSGSEWRLMLGLSSVAGVLLVVLMLPLGDTPRWYLKAGRREDAERELAKIDTGDPGAALTALEQDIEEEGTAASWGEVFSKRWRAPLTIGIGLAVFQQITGINAIIYYADKIFAAAGFTSPADQTAATTWAIGAVNVLATLIAIAFVDRLGRKPLLIAGLTGMAVSLTVVGVAFLSLSDDITAKSSTAANTGRVASDAGVITLVALVVYIASFAFSMGPIVWTMINEIYPRGVRGRAVSVATAANWFSAWLVSQFFLSLVDWIGESATFWLFALMCVVCLVWIVKRVPETKGRTLEEIEQMWLDQGERGGRAGAWDPVQSSSS